MRANANMKQGTEALRTNQDTMVVQYDREDCKLSVFSVLS